MNLLLDTNAWLFTAFEDRRLTKRAAEALDSGDAERHLSAMSIWEVLLLAKKRRVDLGHDPVRWTQESIRAMRLRIVPVTEAEATEASHLDGVRTNDPADRLILATARVRRLVLVTSDRAMLDWGGVETLW